jgi:signal transduction histidine kinase
MLEFFARKWQSLVFRLLFYFLLSMLAIAVVFAVSFTQRIRPQMQHQILPNVARYLHYVIEDIGDPPNLRVAQRLADELPFEIRIEGQGIDWASSPAVGRISSYRFERAPVPYNNLMFSHQRRKEVALIRQHGRQYLFIVDDDFRRGSERQYWLLFASLGLILLLLYIGIRRLFRPIGVISEQVRRIGEGDLRQAIDVEDKGELGMLATGINRMSHQISSMLEGKSGLLLAISHELRSPLTRMRVNLELLDDSATRQKLIADCREMDTLLGAILESEKLSSGHAPLLRRPCQLMDLVDEVVASHPDRDRIHTSLVPLQLNVDELRFKLLLKNLVDNACHYSAATQGRVEITLRSDGGAAVLEVADQGVGIGAEEIPRLNEAFYRPDDARQRDTGGYGLGLYLCQLIVDAHRGELRIESEPGKGTRVIVKLPLDNS